MPPLDRYGSTRPDRTPVYVGTGLLLLALVGWMVWAATARDDDRLAVTSTTVTRTSSEPVTEREVALEAQRRTVTETRTFPGAAPTIVVEPKVQVKQESPPTTGPNGFVADEPVAAVPEDRDATEVSPDPTLDRSTAAETPTSDDGPVSAGETPEAQLAAFVTDVREDLTSLRKEMTALRTQPDVTLDPARQEQLRSLEQRVHELEQRVNSLQSAGTDQLEPLEEELRTALDEIEYDFDKMLGQLGVNTPD